MDRITRRAITIKTFQTSYEARVITLIAFVTSFVFTVLTYPVPTFIALGQTILT